MACPWTLRGKEPSDGHFESPETAFFAYAGHVPAVFAGLGVLCSPQLGVYGPTAYDPLSPLSVIGVSSPFLALPPALQALLMELEEARVIEGEGDYEFFACVSNQFTPTPCGQHGCGSAHHVNLQLHPWVFGTREEAVAVMTGVSLSARIVAGVFSPSGAAPCHQRGAWGHAGPGLPFETVGLMPTFAHDARFSPNNCVLELDPSARYAVFYSMCASLDRDPSAGRRVAITLHCVPVGEGCADTLRAAMKGKRTLGEVVEVFKAVVPEYGARLEAVLDASDGVAALEDQTTAPPSPLPPPPATTKPGPEGGTAGERGQEERKEGEGGGCCAPPGRPNALRSDDGRDVGAGTGTSTSTGTGGAEEEASDSGGAYCSEGKTRHAPDTTRFHAR